MHLNTASSWEIKLAIFAHKQMNRGKNETQKFKLFI